MNEDELLQFLNDSTWDAPFFKRLAHNDTGEAAGNQAGVVIPIELRRFFPALDHSLTSAQAPTVDRFLSAEMFTPTQQVGTAVVRYQFQTWGGTRRAESRLTDNLGPVRNLARRGDMLIMQRSRDRLDWYRLLLVRATDAAFGRFDAVTQGRRWGIFFPDRAPVSQVDLTAARQEMLAAVSQPFVPVRENIPRVATSRTAIARETTFRETLIAEYNRSCAVSGIALATLTLAEAQAAHVISLERGGADEPRNGFTLTGSLHWAFDRGLFGIGDDRRVFVPDRVRAMPENIWLVQYHDHFIAEAVTPELRTNPAAFQWHRENVVSAWN